MSSGSSALLIQLGKRIREHRKKRCWTQSEMAAYLGLSRGHISDLERGTREIGLLTLQIVATGFETTMANLLKGL
jgi:transcriptional regulator with XRE-family HTH domain